MGKQKKAGEKFRPVYFGLRARFLGLLLLVIFFVIGILTLIMYLDQRSLLEKEKNVKAETLTRILGGPAEFYLDRDINTPEEELLLKFEIIKREATNFKEYNPDIVKIVLTDHRGVIRFSTSDHEIGKTTGAAFVKRCLEQKDEALRDCEFEQAAGRGAARSAEPEMVAYRAITYPIFLHYGNIVGMLDDFSKQYIRYHEADPRERAGIYRQLWKKYGETLGDEFDPAKKDTGGELVKEISRAGDIDFLFLRLFSGIMKERNRRIKKGEQWMWDDAWLFRLKKEKIDAYVKDMPSKAKEINDQIIGRMNYLNSQVENVRRLGAVAVVFNMDTIKAGLNQNISRTASIALVMVVIAGVAFLFVLNFMIQNLKRLEKWAMAVSQGDLESKIEISSNDEIGRLGDIFNSMLDEVVQKYHLEKFVSSSTRNMIRKKHQESGIPEPGGTGREKYAFIFSEVMGFTSFSEKNDPATVIEVLNFYLDLQAGIIKSKRGDIDDYTGDQIMAHFGGEKRADTAIETAVAIIKAIAGENAARIKQGLPIFEVGIGVHGGDVVVGNIGSEFRMDFACIGDAVNLTARLCSAAGPGEILVSRDLFATVKKKYPHEQMAPLQVKGKKNEISVVRIRAL